MASRVEFFLESVPTGSSMAIEPTKAPRKTKPTVSVSEMAELLGIHRHTLTGYIRNNACPVVKLSEKGGSPTLVCPQDVVKWYVDFKVEQAAEKMVKDAPARTLEEETDPRLMSEAEAKRQKTVSEALLMRIKLDEAAERVIPKEDAALMLAEFLGPVRRGVLGLSRKVGPDLVGCDEDEIVERLDKAANEMLEKLPAEVAGDDL